MTSTAVTKTPLELPVRQAKVVQAAIEHWASNHSRLISPELAAQLLDSVQVRGFPWDTFAKYTLRLAVLCLAIAVFSTLYEGAFARFWRRVRDVPAWARSLLVAVVGSTVHYYAYYRQQQQNSERGVVKRGVFANEALHGVGALAFALAAIELLEALDKAYATHTRKTPGGGSNRHDDLKSPPPYEETPKAREAKCKRQEQLREQAINSVIFLLASIYGLVALLTGSNFIWSCSIVVTSYWFEAMTCYM